MFIRNYDIRIEEYNKGYMATLALSDLKEKDRRYLSVGDTISVMENEVSEYFPRLYNIIGIQSVTQHTVVLLLEKVGK